MYEVGKAEEIPNAKGLALTITKNFTQFEEHLKHTQIELFHIKLNYMETHCYKPFKSIPPQVTIMMKQ